MSQTPESIFSEACQMQAAEREAYLKGACGNDPALRAKVEALLQADAQAGDFLETAGRHQGKDSVVPAETIPAVGRPGRARHGIS